MGSIPELVVGPPGHTRPEYPCSSSGVGGYVYYKHTLWASDYLPTPTGESSPWIVDIHSAYLGDIWVNLFDPLDGRLRLVLLSREGTPTTISDPLVLQHRATIDLDHLAPPSAIFDRLVHLNTNLVFVASDAKALQGSLDLVYHRLEKDLEWHKLNRFWRGHVSWFVGHPDERVGTYLRFLVDDRVQVCHDGEKTQIIRLCGNDRPAVRGACEWPTDEHSAGLDAAVRLTAARVVRTKPIGEDRIPISLWVRSLCFEELVRVAVHFNNELTQVVDLLGEQGWDFAGRVEAWDRFLRTRSLGYPFSEEMAQLCGSAVSQSTWEVGLFKHARQMTKRNGVPDAGPWRPTELSVHLATFSGLLALMIAEKGWCKDEVDAEVLCMECLGLPDAFGSPLSYIHRRGRRRVSHYAQSHWTGFDDSLIWRHV